MPPSENPPPCGWLADSAHYSDPPPAVARVQMGWRQGPRRAHQGVIKPLCAACVEARRTEVTQAGGRFQIIGTYT
jgi:hypothetical protein